MIEIPNFTIEKEIGRGGMATVYLAKQDMLNRRVALKVLLPNVMKDKNLRGQAKSNFITTIRTHAKVEKFVVITRKLYGKARRTLVVVSSRALIVVKFGFVIIFLQEIM